LIQTSNKFIREALHTFGIKFRSRWAWELEHFFIDLGGDASVFLLPNQHGSTLNDLAHECFHIFPKTPDGIATEDP
jgi:hypothetical protein